MSTVDKFKLNKLHVVPLLNPSQPCCLMPFERHYKSSQEFAHIIDFTALTSDAHDEGINIRARYQINPQCHCYSRGHLRAVRVTAWTEDGSDDKRPLSINTPFPYHPAGTLNVEYKQYNWCVLGPTFTRIVGCKRRSLGKLSIKGMNRKMNIVFSMANCSR